MNDFLKIILSLSFSGALCIILLFICKFLIKNRLSKSWQYYIWLAVIARLWIPISTEITIVNQTYHYLDSSVTTFISDEVIDQIPLVLTDMASDRTESNEQMVNVKNLFDRFINNLWVIWIIGAFTLFVRKITMYRSFANYLKSGRKEVADPEILNRFFEIAEEAGIKQPLDLYTNDLIVSPMLIGFLRPCVILPNAVLQTPQFRYIILHELSHYKRHDMYYKWLIQLTICLHWFNPFVYWMEWEIRRSCELACDETVIRNLNPEGRREYGDTLLNSVLAGGKFKSAVASVTLSENAILLKERLGAIMKFTKKSCIQSVFSIALAIVLCIGFSAAGVNATSGSPAQITASYETNKVKSNTITKKQADKMALELTHLTWVWDWISFFVPYMSEDGRKELVSASENSIWADDIDYSTNQKMKTFTKGMIEDASSKKEKKEKLEKKDIDKHAYKIMKLCRNWDYMEPLLPYMTKSGIKDIKSYYSNQNEKSPKPKKDKKYSSDADKRAIEIMDNSGTWGESLDILFPYMSVDAVIEVVTIYMDRHNYTKSTIDNAISTIEDSYTYMTDDAVKAVKKFLSAYK